MAANPAAARLPPRWQSEPFRVFFPLAVVLGWTGVGHWLLYATSITRTYSCLSHGLIQTEAFLVAFALGFLLTAVPRRTASPLPSLAEMRLAVLLLLVTTAGALTERWVVAEVSYAALFFLLLRFGLLRLLGNVPARRPPASFVLLPIGALYGLAGAVCIAGSVLGALPVATMGLGRLLVEQGVFLCFAVGTGALVMPLIGGAPPPADLGSSARESARLVAFVAIGFTIGATLWLEHAGWPRLAPLLRGGVVAVGLSTGRLWRWPTKPGLHRRLAWLAVWLVPLGLFAAGIRPDYRVPALHILFIGGFGLLAFAIATHVSLGHLGLEPLALGRPPAVILLGTCLILAMLIRLAADATDAYFAYLGWAAAFWLLGSGGWLAFLGPRLLHDAGRPAGP